MSDCYWGYALYCYPEEANLNIDIVFMFSVCIYKEKKFC